MQLITSFRNALNSYLERKNERSKKILINVFSSFIVKGGSVLVGVILVPMSIDYIDPVQYGIWLTISSIAAWIGFFDIGLGNGLRNRLAHALAIGDFSKAKIYVSTTYAILAIVSFLLFLIFLVVIPFVNWKSVLNIPNSVSDNVSSIILVVLTSFCVQFVAQIINIILTATHRPAIASLISFIGQLGILMALIIVRQFVPGSLTVLTWTFTWIPVLVIIVASLYLYSSKLKHLSPSFSSIRMIYSKEILSTGSSFFIISIGTMVLFQTDNIIIAKIINPESVTSYNVVYKYFFVIIMMFSIIITPYWSAFTDANAKKDVDWIRINVKKLRRLWMLVSFVVVPVFLLLSNKFYQVWVGRSIDIPFSLSAVVAIYVIGYICLSVNCFFLNGMGKTKLQVFLYVFSSIINIPIAILLGKSYGLIGVVSSNIIIFIIMNIALWIQVNNVVSDLGDKKK